MSFVRTAPYRALETLSPQEYGAVPEVYLQRRECVHCGQDFFEYSNRGHLQCRLHTGVLRYETGRADYFHSCCGRGWNADGCTEADHLDQLLSDQVELRHTQLINWACVAVPLDMFMYGLVPPRQHCIVMRVDRPVGRQRVLTLALRFANTSLRLSGEEISQQIAQQLSRAPLLQQLLSRKSARQQRRDDAVREVERRMNPTHGPRQQTHGQALEEEEVGQVSTQFIPFLVLTRLAL